MRRRARHHREQRGEGDEVAQEDVRDERADPDVEQMLDELSPKAAPRPRTRVALQPLGPRTFEPPLDRSEDSLEEHGVRTGIAAPDASVERRHDDQGKREPGQKEEDEPEVLRVEAGAEEVEPASDDVEEDRGSAIDLHEGQREVDEHEYGEDDAPSAGEAAINVRGVNEVARAVVSDRARRLVQYRQPPLHGFGSGGASGPASTSSAASLAPGAQSSPCGSFPLTAVFWIDST